MWVGEYGGQRSTLGVIPPDLPLYQELFCGVGLAGWGVAGITNMLHQVWLFTPVLRLELRSS